MQRILLASLLAVSLLLPACWNGAFQTNKSKGRTSGDRFDLVVEAKRNDLDASHFLVDKATGDLWVLETSGSRAGAWVRVANGPADAEELDRFGKRKKNERKDKKDAEES